MAELKAPFPYFGGKSRVADEVWQRLGDVYNYVEPFAGSLAVLLQRPHSPQIETVNDIDCLLSNFWRALKAQPTAVAHWADWPVNEADLQARHNWLTHQLESTDFRQQMMSDPDFYDTKIAGWWVWGLGAWIGSGWCNGLLWKQLPHLGDAGQGVHGLRVRGRLPQMRGPGEGVHRVSQAGNLVAYFNQLAARLRRVRVACGDWSRVCTPTPTWAIGLTGVFLDPPYAAHLRESEIYLFDADLGISVQRWAIEQGKNPLMRIALCGYEGEYDMPSDWECIRWQAQGGYGLLANGRARTNRERERVWFSPHCLRPQPTLFDDL